MSRTWYGSVQNRIEEGHNFTGREIRPGDDGTIYMWSDRHPFWVEAVESQTRIKVREYYHCADHSKPGGMGHQDWLLFKTWDEWNAYGAKYFPQYHNAGEHRDEPEAQTWVFRYGKWMREQTYTAPVKFDERESLFCSPLTDREKKSLEKHGFYKRYYNLSGKVSFGVAEYYYDWEF